MDELALGNQSPLKRKRSEMEENGVTSSALPSAGNATATTSKMASDQVKAAGADGHVTTTGGPITSTKGNDGARPGPTSSTLEDAPALDEAWKTTPEAKSLGILIDRMAQQAYMDLNTAVDRMVALQDDSPATSAQVNGLTSPSVQFDTSERSLQKKTILLDYASDQRDRFTKTLVLTDWAGHNADEIAKVHGLRAFQTEQDTAYKMAHDAIGIMKNKAAYFKVPAPNIEGAMEVLSTGGLSSVPDLGYLPKKKMTAKELLRMLQDMNVALSTRIMLNDELPPQMSNYSIANGRVTFRVAGEFEVDLTIADEEPSSQYYFIDLRLLFSPSPGTLNEQLRSHIELTTNGSLATQGLKGCYDYLHNFVLTHKVNVLRDQVYELIRGKWFDCIKVESLHRSLVVQYWVGVPGPKNWIEIGIVSGKTPKMNAVAAKKATPRLAVRWFRDGQEVLDEKLEFVWEELDMAACLMKVIGKHCCRKLFAALNGLRVLPGGAPLVTMPDITRETFEDADKVKLSLKLPNIDQSVSVRLEPVTGRFVITPISEATARSQQILNSSPNVDVTRVLANLICSAVQIRVLKQAEMIGWRPLRPTPDIKNHFGANVLQRTIFSVPGWSEDWALGISFGLVGERWWIVQLKDRVATGVAHAHLKEMGAAYELLRPGLEPRGQNSLLSPALLEIERSAVVQASYTTLKQQLRDQQLESSLEMDSKDASIIYLPFSTLAPSNRSKHSEAWLEDRIQLIHHGIDEEDTNMARAPVEMEIKASLKPGKMTQLQKYLEPTPDIKTNPTGGLSLRLRAPFGQPVLESLQAQFHSLALLDHRLAVVKQLDYTIIAADLEKLHFTYAAGMSVHLAFPLTGASPETTMNFIPSQGNPHQRIQVLLQKHLNLDTWNAFETFAQSLKLTLPLLHSFDRLQLAHAASQSLVVSCRGITSYQLDYSLPGLGRQCFAIRARMKAKDEVGVVRWQIQQKGPLMPEGSREALSALWSSGAKGWFGLGVGAVADGEGVGDLLGKLDGVMRGIGNSGMTAPALPVEEKEEGMGSVEAQKRLREKALGPQPINPAGQKTNKLPPAAQLKQPLPQQGKPGMQQHDVIMLDD
ncbi:hypothetical protein LTR62_003390 [Meristemomyces frigidus]|uniref:Mediator of RNA polymerase II transcription subunit 14 n=1 Tax=Meristemomyces frigidus TaxID=1508187 RepID=A0AAN7TPL6_9PEZI|nr:hypothetical protein LTR62_003390 [Meristemomyces frigidus]